MRKSPTINRTQLCKRCGNEFTPKGNRVFFCPSCKPIANSERKKKWYIKNNPTAYTPKVINYCISCGEVAKSMYSNQWYCNKHWLRMYNNGTLEPQRRSKNKYVVKDNLVELTSKHGEKIFIDSRDFEKTTKYSWCVSKTGYAVANIKGKVTSLHRYLLSPNKTQIIDHIDGNPLNNTRVNLRVCTHAQNCRNSKLSKNSSLPYPGIKITPSGKYKARITVNYKEIHLGHFNTLDEAVQRRKAAELMYYGEFAPSVGVLRENTSTSNLGSSE